MSLGLPNVIAGVSFGGWIFLTFFAAFIVFTTWRIPSTSIDYYQRNLLYVNSFVLTVVTPLFLWSNLFGFFSDAKNKTILTFNGDDMPSINYFILILTVQIFSSHQIINLSRILYEIWGKPVSMRWISLIAFYKMFFYFLLTQCNTAILLSVIILIIVDYIEHIIATIVYCRMLCCLPENHSDSNTAAGAIQMDNDSIAATPNNNGDGGHGDGHHHHHNGNQFDVFIDGLDNAIEKAIIARDERGNVTVHRARWGLAAVIAHMLSIVPMFIVNFIDDDSSGERVALRFTLVISYCVIAISIWCYKWLIINTPAAWMPPKSGGKE